METTVLQPQQKPGLGVPDDHPEHQTYPREEVFMASMEYFDGDNLAAEVWMDKYAIKDREGKFCELSPVDMHTRMAKEFARIEGGYEFAVEPGGGTDTAKYVEAGKRTGNLFLSITNASDILGGNRKFRKELKSIPNELTNAELSYSINLAAFYKRYPDEFQNWLASKDGGRGILFLEDNDVNSLLDVITKAMLQRVDKIMVHGKSTRTIKVF